MTAKQTLAVLLAEGVLRLRNAPAALEPGATPELDAELLLALAAELPRARLRSHPETRLEGPATEHYRGLIERRAGGEPLAYLTGWREFWSLRLGVSPAVLVPRPETELLVERALALRASREGRVVDLGTGSGAIALALAQERPGWQVMATDISAPALEVARANARALGLTAVEFRHGSWFGPLTGMRFDLIISNPPYVAAHDPVMSAGALACEPRVALTPGDDALASLRAIVRGAPQHLVPGGWLLLEHGAAQGAQVRHELVLAGFGSVRSHSDLAGHERMTEAQHGQI
jgi:release factor glutamine methyltransferase